MFYHKFASNQGKRFAQKIAFDKINTDIIVTVDSDTILKYNAIFKITRIFFDSQIAAATGNCRAFNYKQNLLTRLIDLRYWTAFNQERAAQSFFGVVMCCSGVFSAYRTSAIKQVKESYIQQIFLGETCHFGDDRHITNLILQLGHKVCYVPAAKAMTEVPSTFNKWIKQQIRWNKSFYREILWNIPSISKQPIYMAIDLFLQAILPFFLFFNIMIYIYKGFMFTPLYFIFYLTLMLLIAVIRSIYGAIFSGEARWFLFPIYAFLHVFILIPLRVYALVTLGKNGWGTR